MVCLSKRSVTVGSESISEEDGSVVQGVSAAVLERMVLRAAKEVVTCELARQGVPSRQQ